MKHFFCAAGSVAGLLALCQDEVQAQASGPWPITRLDSVATVRMPYGGTVDETFAVQGVQVYSTATSDNEFDAVVFTPKTDQPIPAGQVWVPDVKACVASLMSLPNKSFARAKLKSTFPVSLPSAPQGWAMHQIYSGFDEFHQSPATLELTWVAVGPILYVFRCSTQLPEEPGAVEDMKHFFTTITFGPRRP